MKSVASLIQKQLLVAYWSIAEKDFISFSHTWRNMAPEKFILAALQRTVRMFSPLWESLKVCSAFKLEYTGVLDSLGIVFKYSSFFYIYFSFPLGIMWPHSFMVVKFWLQHRSWNQDAGICCLQPYILLYVVTYAPRGPGFLKASIVKTRFSLVFKQNILLC